MCNTTVSQAIKKVSQECQERPRELREIASFYNKQLSHALNSQQRCEGCIDALIAARDTASLALSKADPSHLA